MVVSSLVKFLLHMKLLVFVKDSPVMYDHFSFPSNFYAHIGEEEGNHR